nr:reverse transcriptase domain-containing protein [Tanacetum cinerariifolium]
MTTPATVKVVEETCVICGGARPYYDYIATDSNISSACATTDIYGEELTLRIDDEARTFNVGQTLIYSYIDAELINRIDVIDVACEEYVQDVLGFFDNSKSGSPTPTSDHIISYSSRSFTPFEGSDFILEEIDTFLQTPDELSILDDDYYDTEGDILCLEKLLNEDPFPNLPLVKTKDLKQVDATMTNPWVSPVHCVPKKGGMTVVENEDNELIPTRLVTGWRVCIDYQKLNDATPKDHFLLPFMDEMLERLARNEYYC